MRVAVYTIAKQETWCVERWAASAAEADVRLVLDTHPEGATAALARTLGCEAHVRTFTPWRFDVARNAALALLPDDIDWCIALDADEVLQPGWRAALEALPPGVTRPRYRYVWSWTAPDVPDLVYLADKIHPRHGYHWRLPVHEVLAPLDGKELQHVLSGLEIHHHPDASRDRHTLYLELLALAAQEAPGDDRTAFYYARELCLAGRREESAREFRRHLALPSATWRAERAASMRFLAALEPDEGESWLLRACAESPRRREGWLELATLYFRGGRWLEGAAAAERALHITERPLDYLSESRAWGPDLHDVAALCYHNLRLPLHALKHAEAAVALAPEDLRLQANAKSIRARVQASMPAPPALVSVRGTP